MITHNAEGYLDLTAGEAIENAMKEQAAHREYRPLVYIASPFAGKVKRNLYKARGYCRFAVDKGYIPLAPHLHFPQFLDDKNKEEREMGLLFALILLGKCEELWVFGSRITAGMSKEIAKAKKRGFPIRYFNEKCEEVPAHGLSD